MAALNHFASTVLAAGLSLLPIAVIVIAFQTVAIRKPFVHLKRMLAGFILVILGIAFFLEGLELALLPLGKLMAAQLTAPAFLAPQTGAAVAPTYRWIFAFAGCIGLATTLAEPALLAIALKAQQISGGTINAWGLRLAVSLGVASGAALGAFRIVTGIELHYLLATGYGIVILQALFAPRLIIALAFDAGPATTSTITVPLLTALGLGLAAAVPGRNPLLDGFGLIAIAGLCSTITVLAYAQLAHWLGNIRS